MENQPSSDAAQMAADIRRYRGEPPTGAVETPEQGAAPLVGTGEMVSQRVGLEIAVVSLASIFPEDALKAFTREEIMEMGKKNEHLSGHEIFALLKTALTNTNAELGPETPAGNR